MTDEYNNAKALAKKLRGSVMSAPIDIDSVETMTPILIEALAARERAVWLEAAKAWDGMEYSELAKAYPMGKYPKWGNIFAMWCRQQAEKVKP